MRRQILLASVGAIAIAGSALAADLHPPPVYPPPPPIFTWTGVYIGGQIGYAWSIGANNFTGFLPDGTLISTSAGSTSAIPIASG
jgi:outer membrane immunogenic protein